jgi:hypothetical protein
MREDLTPNPFPLLGRGTGASCFGRVLLLKKPKRSQTRSADAQLSKSDAFFSIPHSPPGEGGQGVRSMKRRQSSSITRNQYLDPKRLWNQMALR